MQFRRTGFTLIELLVVVTIIVVLLALLVPAMDKAIYQTELAVCAANQRATASGAVLYAMSNKRFYPYREGVRDDISWISSACIYNGNQAFQAVANGIDSGGGSATNVTVYDDRKRLRSFLNLNASLNDPMVRKLDFDRLDFDCTCMSGYNLWFGYHFKGFAGMKRIGDRLTWQDNNNFTTNRANNKDFLWRFDILVGDHDSNNSNPNGVGSNVRSNHPDKSGILANITIQNGEWGGFGPEFKFALSFWEASGKRGRGPVDLNFGYQDGSVLRHDDAGFNAFGVDPDMAYVPVSNMGTGWQVTMPPQH